METCIVLISVVEHDSARKVCEDIQNVFFGSKDGARKTINKYLGVDEDKHVIILSLNDFMDEVNDQNLDNLSEYFISYINIFE